MSGQAEGQSRLERVLRSGRIAVTAELNPPDSASPDSVYENALVLATLCDAINTTDAAGANVHMSSFATSALLSKAGYEPVMQMSCRDRNRIAIQGDLLGASALGIKNILCLTGDGVQAGDHPDAKPVFDLDSITLLKTAKRMKEKGTFLSGRKLDTNPQLFLGAAANPFVPPFDFRPLRLKKKIDAGAQFIQTQYCFNVARLKAYMQEVNDMGLTDKVFVLIGVGPLKSAKSAEWIRSNVPGVVIPDVVIKRLKGAQSQANEGKKICLEIIEEVLEIKGVSGVHVMAYRQEELVAELITESGILNSRTEKY
ncbi:MAG: 5,10-methylenetetrahydrofolate reductase [Chloroflexi bacterium]|jgi:5,10-methylenetetrahydrofolate reductase|nr:MAG: 5,10-methylenetetrahydrofolate reductase [Chloroflexota bacterium]